MSPMTTKQFQQQHTSISKALNPSETPVKEKHVRSAIIGTFQEKSGAIFWMLALKQPIEENRIVAWKFCHVLHKILREGHPKIIPDSQCYKDKLENIGKMWQYLKDGYGKLIRLYTKLLITKLNFHAHNPAIPGNLQMTNEKLEAIGENDINIYFQISVEMFDYMDEILNLEKAVFSSLDLSRSNSMMPCGQCRLAPLIPLILDASQLYDYCVKILFKLHGALPADTLKGHRDRFSKQFHDLKQFYSLITHMQYFKHLITIPSLTENPPNFLIQSELRTYVTPVVILPQEEQIDAESTVDSLIDTSDSVSVAGDHNDSKNGLISPDALAERDNLIDHLHQENGRQREELRRLLLDHNNIVGDLKNRTRELELQIAGKNNELTQSKQKNDDLNKQYTDLLLQIRELEEKNRSREEKFEKLKNVYSTLREEHINLIRKKAELDKQLGDIKIAKEQIERRKEEAEQRLEEVLQGQATSEQETQRVSEARSKLDEVQKQYDQIKTENLNLTAKIDFISSEKASVEGDLHDLFAQKEELELKINELQSEIERTRTQNKQEFDTAYYELILNCISSAEIIIQNTTSAIENPAMSALTCTPEYLDSLLPATIQSLINLENGYNNYKDNSKESKFLISSVINASYNLSLYLIHARSTSNTSTDISIGDKLTDECKLLASQTFVMLENIKEKSCETLKQIELVKQQLNNISVMANSLSKARDNVDAIGDLVESELQGMDKAIEEAANRIQEMLTKSRAGDSGMKLEVNGKILDSCTELMKAIRKLVQKSRLLQTEIVAQGKGTVTATEFYKRNHQWSEGLISAAKSIAIGAKFLLEAADKVVSGDGKFEQLVVASQGIAASTAQLVVASRVKADRKSTNLVALSEASREVTQATGGVVATAKSCGQLIEENDDLDMSGISLHQAKKLEMEAQVRVLELEQALDTERLKLAALRRHHYQLEDDIHKMN